MPKGAKRFRLLQIKQLSFSLFSVIGSRPEVAMLRTCLVLLAGFASLLGCTVPAGKPDSSPAAAASYSMADFASVRKFDSHTHVNTVDTTGLLAQAERD